ncbi:acetylcholine receptor subunit beta-like 1 [Biomphalaria pfeifferi]|uniref:Acetylcholine receptor subunit beta-like 1 n=1 Tax=Biomphalaria pfeifferi TaxID=112525 RepID=A0AAD8FIK5_BIOPF|nr:acetylcholine receptor subunit beta-like 1 [Biomphalaria pfeifferi]
MLLALSVYLSTVSDMIPRSSLTLPNVIIYLFLLLFLSLITVISSIIVVFLHNKKEKEENQQGVTHTPSAPWGKENHLRLAITSRSNTGNALPIQQPEVKAALNKEHKVIQGPNIDKYKVLGRHINLLLFAIFLIIYIAITLCFTLNIASV